MFEALRSHLFLPIGKVYKFHQNSSQNLITKSDDSRILMKFFKNFDQNTGGKLVANTPDDFEILQEF